MPDIAQRNQLSEELSPYLLQHKDNPVHWQPWADAAFDEARDRNCPILLSIGYAACHWCHVMAHESFEDPAIAAVMNEHFVSIKVDREERPDVDQIYQAALSALGQQGGWPLTMFLRPDGKPFWGGTYFPPDARYGRPGFPDILKTIAEVYQTKTEDIEKNSLAITKAIEAPLSSTGMAAPDMGQILQIGAGIQRLIDPDRGGIKGSEDHQPKFPQARLFAVILDQYLSTGDEAAQKGFVLTLQAMCQGGLYDHVGGGFFRYSTDQLWLIPHFEKMLYDNGLLLELLAKAETYFPHPLWKARAGETVAWLQDDLRVGGGYAAS
ncbi:MAG: DUF255 domain-containing protein, partial [Pseudomonadota bacterium]